MHRSRQSSFFQHYSTKENRILRIRWSFGLVVLLFRDFFSLCLLFYLGWFYRFFYFFFGWLVGAFTRLCLLCDAEGLFHCVDNLATTVISAVAACAMHKVLCIAFLASFKARSLKCVVGTSIAGMPAGVSHVYYHSAPQYTQKQKIGKPTFGE